MNILLDYFFPITAIDPTPAASTAFLKQACVVARPKSPHVAGDLVLCTSNSAVALVTDNVDAAQLFAAGMNRVYILCASDLDLSTFILGHESDFYTLLISSDFTDADIDPTQASGTVTVSSFANLLTTTADTITIGSTVFTAQAGAATLGTGTFQAATDNNTTAASLAAQINGHAVAGALVKATAVSAVVTIQALSPGSAGNAIALAYHDNGSATVGASVSGANLSGGDGFFQGDYTGVVGMASTSDSENTTRAAMKNVCAFHTTSGNHTKNMFFAFGSLLSNSLDWLNQQFIEMPIADDVATIGAANALFDDRVSFVLNDSQFGIRLGFFGQGGKAIVEPYIKRNLEIDMQSAALTYISGNMPGYTKTQAALLQDELNKVILSYIADGWIDNGTVSVVLAQDNFVASASINIAEPKALWRIFGEIQETL